MAVSRLWLVALFFVSLYFPPADSSFYQNLFSPDELSLVNRQSNSLCGNIDCDTSSGNGIYCFATTYGPSCCFSQDLCPGADNPCYPTCSVSQCSIDANYYASCLPDGTTTTAKNYPNPAATPSSTYSDDAAATPSPTYPDNAAASPSSTYCPSDSCEPSTTYDPASPTDAGGSSETQHRSSSSSNGGRKKSKKLPPKVIGGIVTGVVLFFALVGTACLWLLRRFRRGKQTSAASEQPSGPADPPADSHASPEYFKEPEALVSPVSDSSPAWAPQR